MWGSWSPGQETGYQYLGNEYAKLTGVHINLVNLPYSAFQTKLQDAALANSLPALARAGLDPDYDNKLVNLSTIVNNPSDHINKNYIVTDKGKVLNIPSDLTAAGLFINKTLFQEAHVAYPTSPSHTWTWSQFIADATKVREATHAKYDLVFDASPARMRAFVYEFGGNYMHQQPNGQFATDKGTYTALKLFKKMSNNVIMPNSVWIGGQDPSSLFESGQVVAYWAGVWEIPGFTTQITKFHWAAVPTPAQPVQGTDIDFGGGTDVFNNNPSEAAAALKFVQWMYQPKNYTKLCELSGFLPVETGLHVQYPYKDTAALQGYNLYLKEIAIASPTSSYYPTASEEWALRGKYVNNDPTVDQVDLYVENKQSLVQTVQNIIKGYDQQVGGN